jgi:5-methylcytosine-specific restriction endonuclease McrA
MRRLGIFRCFYCDKQLSRQKKTRDHLTPKSRNGSNRPNNIVDACRDCNQLKGSLTLEEFRVVIAFRFGVVQKPKFRFPGETRRQKANED